MPDHENGPGQQCFGTRTDPEHNTDGAMFCQCGYRQGSLTGIQAHPSHGEYLDHEAFDKRIKELTEASHRDDERHFWEMAFCAGSYTAGDEQDCVLFADAALDEWRKRWAR